MADIFFSPPLSGALRRTTQEWAKLPTAKEKPGVKIEKNTICAEKQDNELTDSLQNYHLRRLLMFLYQG